LRTNFFLFFWPELTGLLESLVLDDPVGRLHDDEPLLVESLPARAPRDLVEVAHRHDLDLLAVVLAELREEHGADRDVDAHAERVGAADDLEEPCWLSFSTRRRYFGSSPA
jgi:hypothetical protein